MSTIKDILQEFGDDYVNNLVKAMIDNGSVNMYKDIPDPVLEEKSNEYLLTINLPSPVYFFSEGRAPGKKAPPYEPIKKWIKTHQLVRWQNKITGRFLKDDVMIYLIGQKIARDGTQANAPHFLRDLQFDLTPDFRKKLAIGFRNEVKLEMIKMLKKSQIGTIE